MTFNSVHQIFFILLMTELHDILCEDKTNKLVCGSYLNAYPVKKKMCMDTAHAAFR